MKPQYTFQYELSYTFKQKYILALSYALTQNYINEFALANPGLQTTEFTVINFDHQVSYNATLSAPGDFTPWWTSTNSLSWNYSRYLNQFIVGASRDMGISTFNLNVVETFKLPGDWKAELSGFYNSPSYDGTYHYKSQNSLGAGLQKTLLSKRADLKFNVSDLFNTLHFEGRALYNNVNVFIRNKWESRRFTLAFTYRFGGQADSGNPKSGSGSSYDQTRVGSKG